MVPAPRFPTNFPEARSILHDDTRPTPPGGGPAAGSRFQSGRAAGRLRGGPSASTTNPPSQVGRGTWLSHRMARPSGSRRVPRTCMGVRASAVHSRLHFQSRTASATTHPKSPEAPAPPAQTGPPRELHARNHRRAPNAVAKATALQLRTNNPRERKPSPRGGRGKNISSLLTKNLHRLVRPFGDSILHQLNPEPISSPHLFRISCYSRQLESCMPDSDKQSRSVPRWARISCAAYCGICRSRDCYTPQQSLGPSV